MDLELHLVVQSSPTLSDLMNYFRPGSVGILHMRILEWVAMVSSRGSSKPRDRTQIFHIAGIFFTIWATREAQTMDFQFNSVAQSCPSLCDPWITAHQAFLSITNSWSSHKLMSIESVMPSSHLILCRPLLLLPPISPSIRIFSNESTLHMRWPKYWSFSFSIISSKEIPGLISIRMDWLDLLAVQGISRAFSNKTVQKHQFFGAQPSSQSNSHIHMWLPEKP